MKIILTESQKKLLTNHAENDRPNESCAILFGSKDRERVSVKEVYLTKNIEESPVNFTISNEQLIEGYRLAEEKKMDVVGIFHSHPNSVAAFMSCPNSKKYKCSFISKILSIFPIKVGYT